jgi:hypothetical protein
VQRCGEAGLLLLLHTKTEDSLSAMLPRKRWQYSACSDIPACLTVPMRCFLLLQVGRLVEGKVVWVGEGEVKVILQNNGMEAFIPQVCASVLQALSYVTADFYIRHGCGVAADLRCARACAG